jgi:hypothetical protein
VTAEIRRDVRVVFHLDVVDGHPSILDDDGVSPFGDDPLDERLSGLERVGQHDHVAALRVADSVRQFVDDDAGAVRQRRCHGLALDARGLDNERADREQRELREDEERNAHRCEQNPPQRRNRRVADRRSAPDDEPVRQPEDAGEEDETRPRVPRSAAPGGVQRGPARKRGR